MRIQDTSGCSEMHDYTIGIADYAWNRGEDGKSSLPVQRQERIHC